MSLRNSPLDVVIVVVVGDVEQPAVSLRGRLGAVSVHVFKQHTQLVAMIIANGNSVKCG